MTADLRHRLGDRYAIERELGRGGMGAVYLARDLRLDRPVALKVLQPELAGDGALRERFLRETRTAASFSHPNIVPVHAVEERDGLLAFAMGYVEGESVAERVRRAGPLDVRGVVRLLQDIGYALAYAHGRGVVHRDIKPENIMLERATGRALLMDFGISRSIAAAGIEKPGATRGLTRVGEVVGTAEFMSPEQASGDVVDGRSDLYSLGLVALFALTGRPVITGETTQQILAKQLTEALPPAVSLRPELPEALGAAIDRCVAKDPAARFARAEALVEAIDDAHLAAPEIPVPIRLLAQELATFSLIVVFLAIIGWLVAQSLRRFVGPWSIVPAIFLGAIALTRLLQASSATRRLAILGFRPQEILNGLRATMDEHESHRQQLRQDPDTRRRRRITLIIAAFQLVAAFALIQVSLDPQWSFGMDQPAVRVTVTEGPPKNPATAAKLSMAATGVSMLGISLLLFARSPFRAPIGERLYRLIWLGPIGRAFIALSSRGVAPGAGGRAGSAFITPAPATVHRSTNRLAPAARVDAAPERIATLEERVAALERWRDEASS